MAVEIWVYLGLTMSKIVEFMLQWLMSKNCINPANKVMAKDGTSGQMRANMSHKGVKQRLNGVKQGPNGGL